MADVRLWYRSQRTILGKVHKKKSGQKACNLTARQKWVESNLGFLKNHIVHRPHGSQLGQLPADEEGDDSGPSSSVTQAPPTKKKKTKKDLDTAIIDLLEKTDRQAVNLTAKVDAAMSHGSDEKQAWLDWMLQALNPLPRHLWRDFTKEAFDLVIKYQDRAETEQLEQQHLVQQPLQQSLRPATTHMVMARPSSMPAQWSEDLTQIQSQYQMYPQNNPVSLSAQPQSGTFQQQPSHNSFGGHSRFNLSDSRRGTPTLPSTSQQQPQSSDILAAAARVLND